MEDSAIVALYWARAEQALTETQTKYGAYCRSIAMGILHREEDAQECVNDTYLAAWNAIPPHRPAVLSVFLGKLTRRLSIDRWRRTSAQKRGGSELPLALEELGECVDTQGLPQEKLEEQELAQAISRFLWNQSKTERTVFVLRYWYLDSIAEIAKQLGFSQSKVKSILYRLRIRLSEELKKEELL